MDILKKIVYKYLLVSVTIVALTNSVNAQFEFDYSGPDTLFLGEKCGVVLNWGAPNTPTVSSTVGANIVSFDIHNISGGYNENDVVSGERDVKITYKAEDDEGNSEFFSFTIALKDTLLPFVVNQPVDESYTCETSEGVIIEKLRSWYENKAHMSASDNCGDVFIGTNLSIQEVETQFNQSINDNCGSTRSITLEFYLQDKNGNTSEETYAATFSTFDNKRPQVISNPTPLNLVCNDESEVTLEEWLDNKGGSVVKDNCTDEENITWYFLWSDNQGKTNYEKVGEKPYNLRIKRLCDYSVDINFVAQDECGNKHAAFFTTFVSKDESVPEFQVFPADTIVDCSYGIPYPNVKAYDACKGNLEVLLSEVSDKGSNPDSSDYYNYTVVQTWEANDGCGNFIQHSRTVIIKDTIAPTFTVPDDISIECIDILNLALTGEPEDVLDNCDENPVLSYTDKEVGEGCTFHILREWKLVDVSGNSYTQIQDISVVDEVFPQVEREPSNITLSCDDNVIFENAFNQWIDEKGGAQVTDDCSMMFSAVWEPGTYTIGDQSTYPGKLIAYDKPDTLACSTDSLLYYKDVDFVFFDRCFNTISFTRRFAIVDIVEPELISCPENVSVNIESDECLKTIDLTMPEVEDNCAGKNLEFKKHISKRITSEEQGNRTKPVNPVVLDIGPFDPSETDILDIVDLTMALNNIDANEANEYFVIYGENGEVIDTTPNTKTECGNTTIQLKDIIPLEQFKSWILDGYMTLTLVPNVVSEYGELSINDICGTSSVVVDLTYTRPSHEKLDYYIKIDDSEYTFISKGENVEVEFEPGVHKVFYRVYDCGKNFVECSHEVSIIDNHKPEIVCPDDIAVDLASDSCNMDFVLPVDIEYSDNCDKYFKKTSTLPENPENAYLTFTYNSNIDKFVASSRNYQFDFNSNQQLLKNPRLIVEITGDIDDADEYFQILNESGSIVGTTSHANSYTSKGDCNNLSKTVLNLDIEDFRSWTDDNVISFTIRPFTDSNGISINPCDDSVVNSDGDNDGTSKMFVTLEYDQLNMAYYVQGETDISYTGFDNNFRNTVNLNGGVSQIYYVLTDNFGNRDTCSFQVDILDKKAPKAICSEYYVLFVNPNGVDSTSINPQEVGENSYDNCGIKDMRVVPSYFDCSDSGSNEVVTLYVTDNAGLMDSCNVNVKVEVAPLKPTYESGVCIDDSLKLFANLPDAPENAWTINWTGPNGFSSNLENPVRPNANESYSGTYQVIVTGLNGCQTSGSVEIVVENLSQPEVISSNSKICEGEELLLETGNYSGNVTYYWYEGTYPDGTLLDSSNVSNVVLTPKAGERYYYVVVKSPNCVSYASLSTLVKVLNQPVASVEQSFVSICEGETFKLSTKSVGNSYYWWGPNGFESNLPNPPAKRNVTTLDQGTYYLVVSNDICTDTAAVELVVFDKPITPIIVSDSVFCEGNNMVLKVINITNADNYIWILNGNTVKSQASNSLIIPNLESQYEGDWTVIVKTGNCYSDTSEVKTIRIENNYDVEASNDGPICEGDSVTLFSSSISNASYKWTGPDGVVSYNQNAKILPISGGVYQVEIITEGNCVYNSSTTVKVNPRPKITALSNDAPSCVGGTECVKFYPSVFPNAGYYTYDWTGPNGFVSSDSIAEVCDFDVSKNGIYNLVVYDGKCYSYVKTTEVNAVEIPATPNLETEENVCEGDDILLTVVNKDYQQGDIYHWVTPNKEYKTQEPNFTITSAQNDNFGTYSVFVERAGCLSDSSKEIVINIIPRPNQPFISGPSSVCEGESIELKLVTKYAQGAKYKWNGPDGFTSDLKNPIIYYAKLENTGVYRVSVFVNGCESEISDGVAVEVVEAPDKPEIVPIDDGICVSQDENVLELCVAKLQANTEYYWYINGEPDEPISISDNMCTTFIELSKFKDGTNSIYVVASREGCFSEESDVESFEINFVPERAANGGEDKYICDKNEVFLEAVSDPEGHWEVLSGDVSLENPDKSKTKVINIQNGENLFLWKLSHGTCEDYSVDTVLVFLEYFPEAVNDDYETPYNTSLTFDPRENDISSDNTTVKIPQNENINGELVQNDDGTYTYVPDASFIGTVVLNYEISKTDCPDKKDKGIIEIKVGDNDDCFGNNIITPNGDGLNDYLEFPCLESGIYKDNELLVFNQWGDQVFGEVGYKNNWNGTYNGKDLPVGTYYYLFYPDAENSDRVVKGFLVIER